QQGLIAALCAFLLWGIFPLYFKILDHIPVLEILANRIIWSLLLVLIIIAFTGRFSRLFAALKNRKVMMLFAASTVFIAVNWVTFVWAITNDRILESSLGYYINPLVNVGLGMLFLGERLNRWQGVAIGLATLAVVIMTVMMGSLPWVSLVLGFSFGFYGLIRKKVQAESVVGLTIETGFLFPLSIGYIIYLTYTGSLLGGDLNGSFYEANTILLLAGTGLVTAIPLILFSFGAQRLRLTTIGILQYVAPTMHAVWAIFIFEEEFSQAQFAAFSLIWAGLLIYTWDGLRSKKKISG
ncbi:MAG: EamA family transporter RarD, partial [Sneathiella sp.]|nr:EamA family transporter RarD [Sneathiella sp.]